MLEWIGAALGIAGSAMQYQEDRAQHKYRVQVARARAAKMKAAEYNNAILAEQEAKEVMRVGAVKERLLSRETAKDVASARAAMAKSGFKLSGVARIEGHIRQLSSEDRSELRRQSQRRSDLLQYGADMTRWSADYNAKLASHDPGGPSWGGYFLQGLTGGFQNYQSLGGSLPSFNFNRGGGSQWGTGAPGTGRVPGGFES